MDLITREAIEITRVSARQIHHWDTLGVVSPSGRAAAGSGSRRHYQPLDVLWLVLVRELRGFAIGLDVIRGVRTALQTMGFGLESAEATRLVWTQAGVAYLGESLPDAARAAASHSTSIQLSVGAWAAEVRNKLAGYAPARVHTRVVGGKTHPLVITAAPDGATIRDAELPGGVFRAATEPAAIAQALTALDAADKPSRKRRSTHRAAPGKTSAGAAAWGPAW